MRAGIASVIAGLGLLLAGCGNYNQVNQGWQGSTSPAESGQHGATANQGPPVQHDGKTEQNPESGKQAPAPEAKK